MKKLFFFVVFCFLAMHISASVNAVLDYAAFKHPTTGPYIEIYLHINGGSIIYDSIGPGQFQAKMQIGYLIKKTGTDTTVNFTKFELKSPSYSPNDIAQDLVDIKRLAVPNGDYDLEIIIDDLNSADSATVVESPLSIHFSENSIQFSQIQLANHISASENKGDFIKHGIEIRPNPSAYYPKTMDQLSFYVELYNTEKILGKDAFLIDFKVVKAEDGSIANNLRGFSRKNTAPLLPIIETISIAELPSGNYKLIVEARDKENALLAQSTKFFQRNNPIFTEAVVSDIEQTFAGQYDKLDELEEHIRSLAPISSSDELNYAEFRMEQNDIEQLQKYLYDFWYKRSSNDPAAAWDDYRRNVMYVNENYGSSIRKGYETDPGIVYLRYGKPTTITKSRFEPGAYPYEIWQYNKVKSRTNAKFVFYNRTGQMGEDELLHSNVPGEISNYRWKAVIYGRNEPFKGTDQVDPRDTYGKEVDDFFNAPR